MSNSQLATVGFFLIKKINGAYNRSLPPDRIGRLFVIPRSRMTARRRRIHFRTNKKAMDFPPMAFRILSIFFDITIS